MDIKNFLKIQEKGEIKLINLANVAYVSISEKGIVFYLSTGKSLPFTDSQLGPEEFKQLKGYLMPVPNISRLNGL